MPDFTRHPACAFDTEEQHGLLRLAAGENSVTAGELAIERLIGHVLGRLFSDRRGFDRVDAERAQGLALVAPRIEVPVVPVVHEPLRRDLALERLVLLASPMPYAQPPSGQQRRAECAEVRRFDFARADRQDPDAA
jgi:hypothetical protein